MKRIALLLPGGVANVGRGIHSPPLYQLVSGLSDRFDVTVYSLRSSAEVPARDRCGNALIHNVDSTLRDSFPRKLLAFRRAFEYDHAQRRFDLLHGLWALPAGMSAVLLGMRYHLPTLVSLLGGETANLPRIRYGNMSRPLLRVATRWVCSRATRLAVLTNFQMKQLAAWNMQREDTVVIPLGVDQTLFSPGKKRSRRGPLRLLHVGNLTEVKGQITLLNTFALLQTMIDCRLRIIGPDYVGGAITRHAEHLSLNGSVEFYGRVEHQALPEHYRWADFLLHTPLHDAQGVVVAEAAAAGVIPVGTRTGLMADLKETTDDFVCSSEPQELARGIMELVNDTARQKRLRTCLRQWTKQHSIQWTIQEYARLYERTLS